MIIKKLLLRDGIKLLEATGYRYEGVDSGTRLYYHPNNPRQSILLIPCHFDLDDELSESITIKIYEVINRTSGIKH